MLEKLVGIDNVGVFQKGIPAAINLKKATLVYAENARGKSTLAAVLRSCGSGDVSYLNARATLGAAEPPKVHFRFSNGATSASAIFEKGAWAGNDPRLQVFDQHFVEQNVYAGSEVGPDHHQALLDFALGSKAVAKKREVEQWAEKQVAATKKRTTEDEKLKTHMGNTSPIIFNALPEDKNVDQTIDDLTKRVANATEIAAITARPVVKAITVPAFNFARFRTIALQSLENIHADAGATVAKHVQLLGGGAVEPWLSTGTKLQKDESCPFCGQDTKGSDLIAAYKTHFNAAYAAHMSQVNGLSHEGALPDASIDALATISENNTHFLAAWSQQIKLELPVVDFAAIKTTGTAVRSVLEEIAQAKRKSPLNPADVSKLAAAEESFGKSIEPILAYNTAVTAANTAIADFKKKLAGEDGVELTKKLTRAKLQKLRFSEAVVKIIADRKAADEERDAAEKGKTDARQELDALMLSVLGEFETGINGWLTQFGAPFNIAKLKFNYGGGAPRTEYGIQLRGSTIAAGKKAANAPSFQTLLSEGDKRTLAFAFFLTKLFGDKDIAQSIVVLDDVFTSLDKNRRAETVNAIGKLAESCAQVIVLGHDGYFLNDVSKKLKKDLGCEQLYLQMRRAANDFSQLEAFDLDAFCASDYYKRYVEIAKFLGGEPPGDLLSVAQKLRPLFEGYLHRRFPGHIADNVTVGVAIGEIEKAQKGHPLAILGPIVPALKNLNDFTSAFHHDTAVNHAPRLEVTDKELQTYGQRVMDLIHNGTI